MEIVSRTTSLSGITLYHFTVSASHTTATEIFEVFCDCRTLDLCVLLVSDEWHCRPQYTNKCKILYMKCRYIVIMWWRTELLKWNGSDVFRPMKYCPRSWTTPARRSVLAPKVVTTRVTRQRWQANSTPAATPTNLLLRKLHNLTQSSTMKENWQ